MSSAHTTLPGRFRSLAGWLAALAVLAVASSAPRAGTATVFGPRTYVRGQGTPVTVTDRFTVAQRAGSYTLRVVSDTTASAVITLNGTQVVSPSDFDLGALPSGRPDLQREMDKLDQTPDKFGPRVDTVERAVALKDVNEIAVQVRGRAGASLVVSIVGSGAPGNNKAPVVTIEPPEDVSMPYGIRLVGTVTDDGLPQAAPTVSWSKVSGPGNVIFQWSTDANTLAYFTEVGTYVVQLSADDGEAVGTASVTVNVRRGTGPPPGRPGPPPPSPANSNPSASAGGPYSGVAGRAITFAGSASDPDGDALTCAWSFSDGGTASGAVATHVFSNAGTYTATLRVTDGRGGSAAATAAVSVTAAVTPSTNRPPTGGAGGPYAAAVGEAIVFSGAGSDPDHDPLTFAWNFGDGATAAGPSVAHAYATAGTRTVTLTIGDGRGGIATATATVTVTAPQAGNRPPTADAGGPYSGVVARGIIFTGGGTDADGDSLVYVWSFSDGAVSTGATVSHAFAAPGGYTAMLTVSDARGGAATATAAVTVGSLPPGNRVPTASAGGPYSGTAGYPVAFAGSASDPDNDPLGYSWSFSDGWTATGANPRHAFASAGSYVATLVVSDGHGGLATSTAVATISAPQAGNEPPTASAGGPYNGTMGQAVALTGAGSDPDGDPLTFSWTFSDGGSATGASATHAFSAAGTYTATLTVADGRGGTTAATANVTVAGPPSSNHAPTAAAGGPYNGTAGFDIALTGSASDPDNDPLTFNWSFSDGGSASGAAVTHVFTDAGTHVATLTVTDGRGGSATATAAVTVTAPAPGNRPPTADARGPYSGIAGQAIAFAGSGSDPDNDALTYSWTFSDGDAAAGAAVSHAFTAAGSYTASLTVSDGRGGTTVATAVVTVTAPPAGNQPPTASAGGPYAGVAGASITLAGAGTDADGDPLTFAWNFSDGGSAAGASVTHVFVTSGTYTATLAVSDGHGGTTMATATVAVSETVVPGNQPPTASAGGPYSGTAGQAVTFTGSGSDPDNDALTFTWTFSDGASATGSSVTHTFAAAGSHTATLTVSDGRGGVATVTAPVAIAPPPVENQAPIARLSAPAAGTVAQPLAFDGRASSDPDNDPLTWAWEFGDGASATGATPTHSYAAAGTFTVTVAVSDGQGHTSRASAATRIDLPGNRPPTASAGGPYTGEVGTPVLFSGAQSRDADGDALTYAWSFGDGASGTGQTPAHGYAAAGTFTATLTVTDSHGASASATATVTVTAAADRVPPVVSLTAPREALPGTQVTIAADASDNVKVESVTMAIEGAEGTTFTSAPYQRQYTLPEVAAPGAVIHLTATARDAAGNASSASATITVSSQPDTESPTVTMNAPREAAAGTTATITADARDNTGVASVTLLVDGAAVTSLAAPPYQFSWPVPSSAAPGNSYALVVRAADYAGHATDATASLAVTAVPDTTAPTVAFAMPDTVTAGSTVELAATASDNVGVSSVTFLVEGARVATVMTPPYRTSYLVPAGLAAGTTLHAEARAVDGAGLTTGDTRAAIVATTAAPGEGILFGRVYDDTTGLPLAGATIAARGTSASGQAYSQSSVSDARGAYVLPAPEGQATLTFGKAGQTRLNRTATFVADGSAHRVADARLTPASPVTTVSAVMGGSVSRDGIRLAVPGGALAADAQLSVTAVGGQGLAGALPAGWSPAGVVDIAPPGVSFAQPATLSVPNSAGLPAGTDLVLATWDETAAGWRTVTAGKVGTDGAAMDGSVAASGQYAWLQADVAPAAPPQPAPGALLAGVTASALPDGVTAVVTPDPKVLFYSPGVRSLVTATVTSAAPLSSGTPAAAKLTESYRFASGSEVHPEPTTQDMVLYQAPGGPTQARSVFPVTPSLTFEAVTLQRGVITVELQAPATETGTQVVSSGGGRVEDPSGVRFDAPAGALAQPTPIGLRSLAAGDLGLTLPAGLEFLGGASLAFTGQLAQPGILSIARPAAAVGADRILLVRAAEVQGETRLLLVARARFDGDRLVADVTLPGVGDTLDGVRVAGRYLFVQAAAPLGFSTGIVSAPAGAPLAGALVSQDRLPIVSFSGIGGRYAAGMPGGRAVHTAVDLGRNDRGTATGTIVAGLTTSLNIALVAQPPTVVSVAPADGATNVPLSDPVVVTFSEPLDSATVTPQAVLLTGPAGAVVGTLAVSSNNTVVTLRPSEPLTANTAYTITIASTITDAAGYPLGTAVAAHFTSLDTAPPPMPPAGALSATIPANGKTTVSGTQGTAGLHDTVTIVNVTRGTSAPALVEANGGFSATVDAGLADKLKIEITDEAGNKTTVDVPRYQNADGSVAIGPEGGRITAAGDLALDIAAGTFPAGAVVKFTALTPAEFDSPVKAEWGYPMAGAFEVSASVAPQHYMNVSMPVPPGTDPATPGVVAELVTVLGGVRAMSVVDTAKIVDGRLITSSPPCPGLLGKYGRYAAYLNNDPVRQQSFGMALLTMAPSMREDVFVQGAMLRAPFMPVPIPLYPSFTATNMVTPSSPFIARLLSTGDVAGTLGAADAMGTRPGTACYPVPSDTPMDVILRDSVTGSVVSTVAVTTPAAGASAPVTLFYDPADHTTPTLGYASWNPKTLEADASQPIVLQFSEPMTFTPVPGVDPVIFIDRATGLKSKVAVSLDQNNRQLTLKPLGALPQGHDFTIYAPGLTDLAGNKFGGVLTFKTFEPKVIAPAAVYRLDRSRTALQLGSSLWTARDAAGQPTITDLGFSDVDYLTLSAKESTDKRWHTYLFIVGGSTANTGTALMTVDASKPTEPVALTILPGYGHYYTSIRVFRDFALRPRTTTTPPATVAAWNARTLYYDAAAPTDRICDTGNRDVAGWQARKNAAGRTVSTASGCGDAAVVVDYSIYYSRILTYDVTDPTHPQLVSNRLLSDNGPQFDLPRQEHAAAGFGMAMGFDVSFGADVTHTWPRNGGTSETNTNTNAAYVAMDQLGLGLVDLDRNMPSIERYERSATPPVIESEGFYSLPYYQDVKVIGGKVVAIANDRLGSSGLQVLDVFGPNLATPASDPLSLAMRPRYMAKAENLLYDFDGDGTNERHNLAVVSGNGGALAAVDIDATGTPKLVDVVPVPLEPVVNSGYKVRTSLDSCPDLKLMTSANGDPLFVNTNASTVYHTGTCADVLPDRRLMVGGFPVTAQLTKPTVELAHQDSGGVNNGTHRYLVVFVTPVGKFKGSLPSDTIEVQDVNKDGQVKLTNIPTSLFATSREIYRTPRGMDAGPYKFVAAIDNVSTEYVDNMDDRVLGDYAPTAEMPTILATDITVLDLLPKVAIKSMGKVTVDTESKVAYVAGSWTEDTTEYQGILAFDLGQLAKGLLDANRDGWDDRLLSKTKITGPNAPVTNGNITGVRYDAQRKLLYATYRSNQDPEQTYVAIVKTCECPEAKVSLVEGGIPGTIPRSFPATNDTQAVVFITSDVVQEGKVRARFDVSAPDGTTVNYDVIEQPISGNPADALVDLASGRNHGTLDPSDPRLTFYLNSSTLAGMAGPSVLIVDLTDDQGNFIKRTFLVLVPGGIPVSPAVVRTVVDKTNKKTTGYTDYLSFALPYEASVTITVDGSVLQALRGGALMPIKDVPMTAGVNRIEITPQMIPGPGEHPFVLTAVFRDPDSRTVVTGALEHAITLTESLPIGQTFEKGVSLSDGHLSLSRTDINIPAVGPPLQFGRSYSSADSRSSGPMGAGWTHTYEAKLTVDSTGDVTLNAGDGGGGRFTQAGAAPGGGMLFKPQAGYHGSLVYVNGGYDYYSKVRYRYHYDASVDSLGRNEYRLTYVEDPHGNRQTIAYAGSLVSEIKDASGRTLKFTYEKKGVPAEDRVVRIDGPLGLALQFAYDAYGNLVSATRGDAAGTTVTPLRAEQYEYSLTIPTDRHNLLKVVDPNGNPTEYVYFQPGDAFPGEVATYTPGVSVMTIPMKYELVKQVKEGSGAEQAVTSFAFDYSNFATRLVTRVTDARGLLTTYTLNPRGTISEKRVATAAGDVVTKMKWAFEAGIDDVYLVEQTDALGRVTTFQYDANGNVTREAVQVGSGSYAEVKSGAGVPVTEVVTTYQYDPKWNKATLKVDPEGNRTEWTIDAATGDVLSMTTDPKDGTGAKIVKTFAFGDITTARGSLKGVPTQLTDPLGHTIRYTAFDEWGNATESLDGLGNRSVFRYDARGRLLESSDGLGHHSTTTYDALDQVVRTQTFVGVQPADASMASPDVVSTREYLAGGQLKKTSNRPSHSSTITYDTLNRPVTQTDQTVNADGAAVTITQSYTYDGEGNRTTHTDGRGITQSYTYDEFGRATRTAIGTKVLSTSRFDAAGNLLAQTDLHGHQTRYEYDRLYRNVRTILPLAPYTVSTEYDLLGHPLRSVDANGHATSMTYDGVYRLTSKTDPMGGTASYTYDAIGNVLTETHNRSGLTVVNGPFDAINRSLGSRKRFNDPLTASPVEYATTTSYDDAAHTATTTTPAGTVTVTRFNGLGKEVSVTVDPAGLGLTTTYRYDEGGMLTGIKLPGSADEDRTETYDGVGRLVRRALPLGGVERFYYNGNGAEERGIDARGVTREHTYDDLDRLLKTTVSGGPGGGASTDLVRYVYDDAANTTTRFDAADREIRSERDALDREIVAVDALGQRLLSRYDGVNRVGETDRNGNVREFQYDALDRLIRATEVGGPTSVSVTYVDAANQKIEADRRGVQSITQYDALGRARQTKVSHPDLAGEYGAAEIVIGEQRYDGDDHVTHVIDPLGRVTFNEYDGAGRLSRSTAGYGTPNAAVTSQTYDGSGNILTRTDALNHVTTITYDARHRRVRQEDPLGRATSFTYDQGGNIETLTEPGGDPRVTRYRYDGLGRLVAVDETRGGAGGVTQYAYDSVGNRISDVDASGVNRTWAYDALNRVTDSHVDGRQHWHYEYDANGNVTLTVDANGQRIAKTYDYLGRVSSKAYSNHVPGADGQPLYPQVVGFTYSYDPAGNQTRVVERKATAADATVDETTTREYDHLNRVVKETNPDGKTLAYTYDRFGNRLTLTDGDGVATSWTYDELNRMKMVTTELGATTGQTQYDYYANGLEKEIRYPNGSVVQSTYDAADQLTGRVNKSGETEVSRYQYTYDANGNRSSETEVHQRLWGTDARSTTYEYDALNRLTKATYGDQPVSYTYAANGDRLSEVGTDPATGTAVNRTFEYDAAGQLLRIVNAADPQSSLALQYDANGNTTGKAIGLLANGTIATPRETYRYEFDIKDRLARAAGPGGTMRYQYDDQSRRTRATGPMYDIKFLSGPEGVVQEYDAAGLGTTTKYNYGRGLVSTVTVNPGKRNSFFYLFDGLRSSSELTDENGVTQASYAYDAWGNLRASLDTTSNRRKYTGHYFDTETGLQYFNARYYDATTGRFLSRDPAAGNDRLPISRQPYVYGQDNPLAFVDPSGREAAPAGDSNLANPNDSGAVMFAKWGAGVVKGIGNAIIGDLIKSGVEGLADIAMAGVGYLAIEATQGQYVDEIGALLTPVSGMGKAAAEKGTATAIREAATGIVKGIVTAPITLPARLVDAARSGNPEDVGRVATELVQLRGPLEHTVRTVQRARITADLMLRERVGPKAMDSFLPEQRQRLGEQWRGSEAGAEIRGSQQGGRNLAMNLEKKLTGPITLNDAWQLAGMCTAPGVGGCAFQGGFGSRSIKNVWNNLTAEKSLGAKWTMDPHSKLGGDIDMEIHIDGRPTMTDAVGARRANASMSAQMLDPSPDHGLMGEYMPARMLKKQWIDRFEAAGGRVEEIWAVHDPQRPGVWTKERTVRSYDYMTKGIKVIQDGQLVSKAPFLKHGTDTVFRNLQSDAFRFWSLPDGPPPPALKVLGVEFDLFGFGPITGWSLGNWRSYLQEKDDK